MKLQNKKLLTKIKTLKTKGFSLLEVFFSLAVLMIVSYALSNYFMQSYLLSEALVYKGRIFDALKLSSTILKHQSNYFSLLQLDTRYWCQVNATKKIPPLGASGIDLNPKYCTIPLNADYINNAPIPSSITNQDDPTKQISFPVQKTLKELANFVTPKYLSTYTLMHDFPCLIYQPAAYKLYGTYSTLPVNANFHDYLVMVSDHPLDRNFNQVLRRTINHLGTYAGLYNAKTDTVVGNGNSFEVKNFSQVVGNNLQYCKDDTANSNITLSNNAIVIDLDAYMNIGNLEESQALSAYKDADNASRLGSRSNTNTLNTNIVAEHGVNFAPNNAVTIVQSDQDSTIMAVNAGIISGSIQLKGIHTYGEQCFDFGAMSAMKNGTILTCAITPAYPNYAWVPISFYKVVYSIDPSDKLSSASANCSDRHPDVPYAEFHTASGSGEIKQYDLIDCLKKTQ